MELIFFLDLRIYLDLNTLTQSVLQVLPSYVKLESSDVGQALWVGGLAIKRGFHNRACLNRGWL